MPLEGGLDHINLYLLEDDDGWFVVDTGWNDDRTERLWNGIFEAHLSDKPVKGVICTHFHPDHIGQARMITDLFRCPLYMTFKEFYQALSFSGASRRNQSWQAEEFYARAGMNEAFSKELRKMVDRGNPMASHTRRTPIH